VVNLTAQQSALRARNALWATFGVMGIVSMAWVPRIPEIRDALHLSNGQFGILLMGSTFGSLSGAQLAGRLIHTHGSQAISSVAVTIMPLGLIGIGYSKTATALFISLFVMGFGYSSLDISVNTQAIAVEKLLGRRWMSSFHALWSTGAFVTTVLGGSIARFTTPQFNLVMIGLVSLLLYIPAVRALLNAELDGHDGGLEETQAKIPLIGRTVIPLWAIGIGLFGALVAEGAMGDWSAILLRDHMGITKGVNASAYACFALAMIVSRFLGDRVLERFGPEKTVRWGGYIGGTGLGLSIAMAIPLSAHSKLASLIVISIGFIIAGLGMGPIFPAYILAASKVPGIAPSVAIARVGVIGLMAFFIGPSLTGGLAQITSLPIAMALPTVMFIFAGYQARVIKVQSFDAHS
jgi:fucose permease